ncbi:MAG: ribose-phosphate pyrophosphokinase [Alphaproteobacteria bacterium]|nr:MAG: ribose-phosphate pyrophosphokinase [Alphaproteobacteria bacterium]
MAIADLFDVDHIKGLLQASASAGVAMSYSEILLALGHRFTRPKMRALCKVLDAIDGRAAAAGQPELAVLVVREGDRLPGQGWWVGRDAPVDSWTGAEARALVAAIQQQAFDYWRNAAG